MYRNSLTVYRAFHDILYVLSGLHNEFVVDPPAETPEVLKDNPKFFAFFDRCVGALDGSHIPISVGGEEANPYGNRKGWKSQNVLAACDFSGNFVYVLAGWEGSAHDGRVLRDARNKGWKAPAEGYYYLADAGYTNTELTMVSYRGVRYHLQEWAKTTQRPQNAKELFNRRHSSLRNVIERVFGILKARFRILSLSHRGFSIETQEEIVYALTALHNIINTFQPENPKNWLIPEIPANDDPRDECTASGYIHEAGMSAVRDAVARMMFKDYTRYLDLFRREVEEGQEQQLLE